VREKPFSENFAGLQIMDFSRTVRILDDLQVCANNGDVA
jgi:hypothetical protein